MCDRECICKTCVNNCCLCPLADEKLSECRSGGIKKCDMYDGVKEKEGE